MKLKRLLYGWFDPMTKTYRVSFSPPDAPTRPLYAEAMERSEIEEFAARKRGKILWHPPLPQQASL